MSLSRYAPRVLALVVVMALITAWHPAAAPADPAHGPPRALAAGAPSPADRPGEGDSEQGSPGTADRRIQPSGGGLIVGLSEDSSPPASLIGVVIALGISAGALVALVGLLLMRRGERRRHQIEEERRRDRALLNSFTDIVARNGPDLRCLYLSPRLGELGGFSADQFLGRRPAEMEELGPVGGQWDDALRRARERKGSVRFAFALPVRGRLHHFESEVVAEVDADGEVVSLLSTTRDVTELHTVTEELRRARDYAQAVVASMADGVIVHGPNGVIVDCNPAAERILGRNRGWLVGRPSDALGWRSVTDSGSDPSLQEHPADRALRLGTPQRNRLMHTERPDGTPVWVSVSSQALRFDDEPRAVTTLTDVTNRLDAEREQAALRRLATLVASAADPAIIFASIAEEAAMAAGADGAAVVRFVRGRRAMRAVGSWHAVGHLPPTPPGASGDYPVEACTAVARVAVSGRAERIEATSGMTLCSPLVAQGSPSESVGVPVVVDGALWGALVVVSSGSDGLAAESEGRLGHLGEIASLAIASSEARAQLTALASTDHLTGLLNRRGFEERLAAEVESARRSGHDLALVLFDIDHFKLVNDTHGHPIGDRVLTEFADRMRELVRSGEIVARVGGEEFAWILPGANASAAELSAERLRTEIAALPFDGIGRLTISAGLCALADVEGDSDLFRLADIALYWAKTQGRNRVFRYSPETIAMLPAAEQEERLGRARSFASVQALARAVDAKDPLTQRHSERVAAMARRLAAVSGWSSERGELLHEAALVHDVGKIAIPDSILFASRPLTPAERVRVREHSAIGAAMLEGSLSDEQVAWVRGHHERPDGRGYPDGLIGGDIPDGARLLALADAWDAMTVARPYGVPRSVEDALVECQRMAGSQFDSAAVRALAVSLAQEGRRPDPPG